MPNGRYMVEELGHSNVAGEKTLARSSTCRSGREVYEALVEHTGGRLSRLAGAALQRAAAQDEYFASTIEDVLAQERVDAIDLLPPAGTAVDVDGAWERIVLRRSGQRALRFPGRHIGHGTSRIEGADAWTEIDVYRTAYGSLVAAKKLVLEQRGIMRSNVIVVNTAADVVRRFSRRGVGWVEGALIDALAAAYQQDQALACEIGRDAKCSYRVPNGEACGRTYTADVHDIAAWCHDYVPGIAQWAHAIVGGSEVQAGDARYRVLEFLEQNPGVYLVTADYDRIGFPDVEGFVSPSHGLLDTAEVPVDQEIVLALSRQRLIRTVDTESANLDLAGDLTAWEISPKGRDALTRSGREP